MKIEAPTSDTALSNAAGATLRDAVASAPRSGAPGAALTGSDAALLAALTAGLGGGGANNLLAQLTGVGYDASDPPGFLAVRTGAGVTDQYAGGYSTVGWVDGRGNNVTFFATGTSPDAGKGVAISFGAATSDSDRQAVVRAAMHYLGDHLMDTQDASGDWSQPTFDVRV